MKREVNEKIVLSAGELRRCIILGFQVMHPDVCPKEVPIESINVDFTIDIHNTLDVTGAALMFKNNTTEYACHPYYSE